MPAALLSLPDTTPATASLASTANAAPIAGEQTGDFAARLAEFLAALATDGTATTGDPSNAVGTARDARMLAPASGMMTANPPNLTGPATGGAAPQPEDSLLPRPAVTPAMDASEFPAAVQAQPPPAEPSAPRGPIAAVPTLPGLMSTRTPSRPVSPTDGVAGASRLASTPVPQPAPIAGTRNLPVDGASVAAQSMVPGAVAAAPPRNDSAPSGSPDTVRATTFAPPQKDPATAPVVTTPEMDTHAQGTPPVGVRDPSLRRQRQRGCATEAHAWAVERVSQAAARTSPPSKDGPGVAHGDATLPAAQSADLPPIVTSPVAAAIPVSTTADTLSPPTPTVDSAAPDPTVHASGAVAQTARYPDSLAPSAAALPPDRGITRTIAPIAQDATRSATPPETTRQEGPAGSGSAATQREMPPAPQPSADTTSAHDRRGSDPHSTTMSSLPASTAATTSHAAPAPDPVGSPVPVSDLGKTALPPPLAQSTPPASPITPATVTTPPPAVLPAPSPSAGELPAASPHVSPSQQVAPVLLALATAPTGSQRIMLRLQPAELGPVQVRIDRPVEAPIRVEISVSRPETLALMLRDQTQLQRALDQAGLPSDRCAMTLQLAGQDSDGLSRQPQGFDRPDAGAGSMSNQAIADDQPDADAPATFIPSAQLRWRRLGLDITA